jgi:hypothetical protein
MRTIAVSAILLLSSAVANAQDAPQVVQQLTALCMQASGADAQRCSCYANVVLGMLSPEDTIALLHGQETPNTERVNETAKARCGIPG